jgi:hypothetical protein
VSRIGRKPIPVLDGVTVKVEPEVVHVTGPRGALSERKSRDIGVDQEDGTLVVDELGHDAPVGAEDGDPRTGRGAAHLGADAATALEPARFLRDKTHARLPTFLATCSPS